MCWLRILKKIFNILDFFSRILHQSYFVQFWLLVFLFCFPYHVKNYFLFICFVLDFKFRNCYITAYGTFFNVFEFSTWNYMLGSTAGEKVYSIVFFFVFLFLFFFISVEFMRLILRYLVKFKIFSPYYVYSFYETLEIFL